jgi:Xaa-Pro aminopeptidase
MEAPADSTWRGYSLAERDRRWEAVRANAAKEGFDCLFVPLGNGLDARYLTQLRVASIILPTDGREPIVITDQGNSNDWAPTTRAANREWTQPMIQALRDLGMERARIGVSGLRGGTVSHVRSPDGCVVASAFTEVVAALPNARFENATDVVGFARYVKGREEIECLRHSAAIAEAGIDEMQELARVGADLGGVYARVMGRMLALGSEYQPLALKVGPIDGPEGPRQVNPPIGQRLQANDLINNECTAVWGHQVSQEDQPILLGPIPDPWKPIIELQRELFETGLEAMKPGTTFGELIDLINGIGPKRGPKPGMKSRILMHGRGYGDDGPLLSPRALGKEIRDLRIEENTAWVWKPTALSADERLQFTWGGDVVVTPKGGEVLFKRPHGMVAIPRS